MLKVQEYLFGLVALGKTELVVQFCIVRAQMPPSGEHNFAASKATDHDVVGDEIENNSSNPQTLVVEKTNK
ncbi:hypothetical protein TNCV_2928111 [Trichonephila clavipes]|nr:hypothetical protein TNCV_2928111 [Trichonephila clavipes]